MSSSRQPLPEAEVYKRVGHFEDRLPSILGLLCGGDVLYEDGQELKVLDTAAVRGGWMDDTSAKILHRLVLSTVGEPLWKYTDEPQLLRAFHAIIEAHQRLAERGILHCDISPGNLLLASGLSAYVSGILTDFDGAYIDEELFNRVAHDAHDPGRVGPMQTNAMATKSSLSGTRQFMATHLLYAVERKGTAEHTAAHDDLESIGYVFGYAHPHPPLPSQHARVRGG
ncbi:hypothetical protein FOMPIDRAFT_98712 [Fomitopsis schrenkii]|uniref:Protein kinase domain-containing protein n=1 Tax=Fomitopsis schrenkii TaxID=2126942 RepID=S8F8A1_FOMSC|nr:hypothetical protein FOMPIDRAFT_98712 [Fomitopsis schrenkii]